MFHEIETLILQPDQDIRITLNNKVWHLYVRDHETGKTAATTMMSGLEHASLLFTWANNHEYKGPETALMRVEAERVMDRLEAQVPEGYPLQLFRLFL